MKYLIAFLFFMSASLKAQTDFEKGENYFRLQKYLVAKPIFERHVKRHPDDLKSLEYLGDIEAHLKHWNAAIAIYASLITKKPVEAEYRYKFGGASAMLAKESNRIKALSMVNAIKSAFEKTIALNPQHIGARWALIELYLQLPGIFGGSENKALEYSTQLARISPVDGFLSHGRIDEYFERYTNAEIQYKKAIVAGNSQTTYQKLADLYKNKMEQPEKARQVLAAFVEKNKS